MWLFTRYGFFSIACARGPDGSIDPEHMVIRARRKAHLQNLQARFPDLAASIAAAPDPDYRYHIVVPRTGWTAALSALAEEQASSNLKDESAGRQGGASDSVDALHRVWDVMYGFQCADRLQLVLVERGDDGAISNAERLLADDLAGQKVLCPECGRKVFISWPEGWDGHSAYACTIPGATPEERRANYKERYRRLFR